MSATGAHSARTRDGPLSDHARRNITDCASNLAASWAIARSNVAKVGGGSMLTEFGAVGVHESSIEVGAACVTVAPRANARDVVECA